MAVNYGYPAVIGAVICDGYSSVISAFFGCPPVTSFSQNVGLINMTKVVNRFTIATGAGCMILAGLLPPVGNFFASLPESVFSANVVAVVFVVSILLNLILPKNMEVDKLD